MRVAWLGTGLLGLPMAERVVAGGHDLVAWNRTTSKAQPLAQRGARVVETTAQALEGAEAVVLMLQDAAAIGQVLGSAEVGNRLQGRTVIQMGTIAPDESVDLARRLECSGSDYLEAPVLGSIPQARDGTLIVMVGGTEEQLQRWRPLFECFGRDPLLVGPVGHAATLKLALNHLIAALTAAFSYSLGMVRRANLDVELFMRILRDSALYAPTFDKKLTRMLQRDFASPNFPVRHMLKDVRLVRREGARLGVDTRLIGALESILERADQAGLGDDDYSALYNAVDPEAAPTADTANRDADCDL